MGFLFGCKQADQDGFGVHVEGKHDLLVAASAV